MKKNILRKALQYAQLKHMGQSYNGQPFVVHPILTAQIMEVVTPHDENLIAAAYLHDVMEDCGITFKELEKTFNTDIADLVEQVTKTDYNTFPRLLSTRAILLKFADRLSNLSNMRVWSAEKQLAYIEKSRFWKS